MARTLVSSVPAALTGNALPLPSFTTAQRDSIASPAEGTTIYNTDSDRVEVRKSSTWEASASVPIGTILPWIGGYFTNGSNAGFTSVLGNTVAAVNALLNSSGYYVCDGSALNLSGSPIFNGAARYLPDLTDSRFLQGATMAGAIGGINELTLAASNLPAFTVSTDFFAGVSSTTSAASTSHTHPVRGSTVATIGRDADNGVIYIFEDSTDFTSTRYIRADDGTDRPIETVSVSSRTVENTVSTLGSTAGPNQSTSLPTTSNIPSHTHTITTGPANGGMNAAPLENRPSYLSVFYIQRVI